MNIRKVLQSGNVVRFHNHIGVDKQKNSEHQWETALILQHIYPQCSKDLLLAALTHDAAEYFTGDIPFPTKQASPELKLTLDKLEEEWEKEQGVYFDLNHEEKFFLKLADTFSGMWYCILQVREGKINAKRAFRKWAEFASVSISRNIEGDKDLDIPSTKYCASCEMLDNMTLEMERL